MYICWLQTQRMLLHWACSVCTVHLLIADTADAVTLGMLCMYCTFVDCRHSGCCYTGHALYVLYICWLQTQRMPLHWACSAGLHYIESYYMYICWLQTQRMPLHWACSAGRTEVVEILLKMRAPVNARDEVSLESWAITPRKKYICFQTYFLPQLYTFYGTFSRKLFKILSWSYFTFWYPTS